MSSAQLESKDEWWHICIFASIKDQSKVFCSSKVMKHMKDFILMHLTRIWSVLTQCFYYKSNVRTSAKHDIYKSANETLVWIVFYFSDSKKSDRRISFGKLDTRAKRNGVSIFIIAP